MAGPFDFMGGPSAPSTVQQVGGSRVQPFGVMDVLGIGSGARSQARGYAHEADIHARDQGQAAVDAKNQLAAVQAFATYTKSQDPSIPFNKQLLGFVSSPEGATVIAKHGVGVEHLKDLVEAYKDPERVLSPGQGVATMGADGKYSNNYTQPMKEDSPIEQITRRAMTNGFLSLTPDEQKIYHDAHMGNILSGLLSNGPTPGTAPAAPAAAPQQATPIPQKQAAPAAATAPAPSAPAASDPTDPGVEAPQLPTFPDEQTARDAINAGGVDTSRGVVIGGKTKYPHVKPAPQVMPQKPQVPTGK